MSWIEKLRTTLGATSGDITVALFTGLTALAGFFYTTFFDRRSPAEEGRELRLLALRHDSVVLALRRARLQSLARRFGDGVPVPELALAPLDTAGSVDVEAIESEQAAEPSSLFAPMPEGEVPPPTVALRSDTVRLGGGTIAPPLSVRAPNGPPRTPLDINTAPLDQLERLPGVGDILAQRIVEHRRRERFVRVEDVMKVKGIGEGKFAKMRPYIVVR